MRIKLEEEGQRQIILVQDHQMVTCRGGGGGSLPISDHYLIKNDQTCIHKSVADVDFCSRQYWNVPMRDTLSRLDWVQSTDLPSYDQIFFG